MLKIPDSIRDIIDQNPFLRFGFVNNLFNLTKLAKFISPLIKARSKKDVTDSAILMNLSRLSKLNKKTSPNVDHFKIDSLTVYSDLVLYTFHNFTHTQDKVFELYRELKKNNSYAALTEGASEINLIVEKTYNQKVNDVINEKPKKIFEDLSALVIKFNEKYTEMPGMFYFLIQQITLQGVNLIDLSSTSTELVFYISKKDIKISFDSLQYSFTAFNSLY